MIGALLGLAFRVLKQGKLIRSEDRERGVIDGFRGRGWSASDSTPRVNVCQDYIHLTCLSEGMCRQCRFGAEKRRVFSRPAISQFHG